LAKFNQDSTLGMLGEVTGNLNLSELIGFSITWTHQSFLIKKKPSIHFSIESCMFFANLCYSRSQTFFLVTVMISSMTAFARAQYQLEQCVVIWEIKSVNHRYLETWFRMPDEFRFLEGACRGLMREGIHRGKLDCQLKIQFLDQNAPRLNLNESLIQSLILTADRLAQSGQIANDLAVSDILRFPGVVASNQFDNEAISQCVLDTFKQALNQLLAGRNQEGAQLQQVIRQRLVELSNTVEQARGLIADLAGNQKAKLLAKLEYLQLSVPEGRIEQEIAIMLTRMDVAEEIDRLATHIFEVDKALQQGKVAGRKLDFLMQELNREANTLSSKSDSTTLTQLAVEMKVLIEQMREQIQNIE
jgi:uncharacterized protein (TIGR00255 family)